MRLVFKRSSGIDKTKLPTFAVYIWLLSELDGRARMVQSRNCLLLSCSGTERIIVCYCNMDTLLGNWIYNFSKKM